MCRINYSELSFDHIVTFNQEDSIFATGRDGAGKTRIFLVFSNDKERVYTRNGVVESWEVLNEEDGRTVINRINDSVDKGIAVYKFNGESRAVTGPIVSNN